MTPMRANRSAERRHQDQGFHRSLPLRRRVNGFWQLGNVGPGVLQRHELASTRQWDRIVKQSFPTALGPHAAARSSFSTPRATIFSAVSGNGRCRALASSHGPRIQTSRYSLVVRIGWLEVECNRCTTRDSLPLDAIRRPRETPIWKLEAALKCPSCNNGRYAPPVHMIKMTETREITPYLWVHPTRSDSCAPKAGHLADRASDLVHASNTGTVFPDRLGRIERV
jgi:hypothetical protein